MQKFWKASNSCTRNFAKMQLFFAGLSNQPVLSFYKGFFSLWWRELPLCQDGLASWGGRLSRWSPPSWHFLSRWKSHHDTFCQDSCQLRKKVSWYILHLDNVSHTFSILTTFCRKVSWCDFHLDKKCHDGGVHLDSWPPQEPNPSWHLVCSNE